MRSSVAQRTLDAFLVRGAREPNRSNPSSDALARDGDENVDPSAARAVANWARVACGVARERGSSASSSGRDYATAVKRAAYAYATTTRNARRRLRGREDTLVGDLWAHSSGRASERARRRLGAAVSGGAARALKEYGACALPRVATTSASAANNAVSAIEFDASGTVVTTGTVAGAIDVQDVATLRAHGGELYAPRLKLSTARYIESLRWSGDRSMVLTTCDSSNTVVAYRGDTARVPGPRGISQETVVFREFKVETSVNEPLSNGLRDLSFDPSDPHRMIASAGNGQAYVWDTRTPSGKQTAQLASHLKTPIASLVVSHDGHTIIGGESSTGEVLIWDMRKPFSQGGAAFGAIGDRTHRYGLIAQLSIAKLLHKTVLGTEANIEHTGVQWIGCDPRDSRRLGFHLVNGWSGVVDLMKPCVTHAHCPPPPWLEAPRPENVPENAIAPTIHNIPISDSRRRQACWLPDGRSFAVGLGVKPGLRVLDFAPSAASRHWVHGLTVADFDREPERRYASGGEPVFVETSSKVYTVAAHPFGGEIMAGGESTLSLLRFGRHVAESDLVESTEAVLTDGPATVEASQVASEVRN